MSEQEIRAQFQLLQAQVAELDAQKKAEQLEAIEAQRAILRELEEALGLHTVPVSAGGANTPRNLTKRVGKVTHQAGSQSEWITAWVRCQEVGTTFSVRELTESLNRQLVEEKVPDMKRGGIQMQVQGGRVRDHLDHWEGTFVVKTPGGYARLAE